MTSTIKDTFFGNDDNIIVVAIKPNGDNNIQIEQIGTKCSELKNPNEFIKEQNKNFVKDINELIKGGKKQKKSKKSKKSSKKTRKARRK